MDEIEGQLALFEQGDTVTLDVWSDTGLIRSETFVEWHLWNDETDED